MHILFVTDYIPYPTISGDRIRVYHLAKRIAEVHRVSFAAPVRTPEEAEGVEGLRGFCQHILTADLPESNPIVHLPGLFRTAVKERPLELHFLTSARLMRQIHTLIEADSIDIVQFEHSRMAHYRDAVPAGTNLKTVLTFHNVAWRQFDTIYKITRPPLKKIRAWLFSRQMRRWEMQCIQTFDRCVTVSENDRQLLLQDVPGKSVDIVPNGVDTRANQLQPRLQNPPTLLLVGLMSYAPYIDSVLYFCQTILPTVRKAIGGIRVLIVGPNPPSQVKRLEGDGVHVTGCVPDVIPFYTESTVSVVPLRAGGGTRLKILESMALGRPVVCTSLGCEGLNVTDDEHLLIADTPERFADCILRLLNDAPLYDRIVRGARQRVEEQYDWDTLAARMLRIYEEVGQA